MWLFDLEKKHKCEFLKDHVNNTKYALFYEVKEIFCHWIMC